MNAIAPSSARTPRSTRRRSLRILRRGFGCAAVEGLRRSTEGGSLVACGSRPSALMIGALVGASTPPSASIVTATAEPGRHRARELQDVSRVVRPRTCRPGGASRPRRPTPRTSCPPAPARGRRRRAPRRPRRSRRRVRRRPPAGPIARSGSARIARTDRSSVEVVRDGVRPEPNAKCDRSCGSGRGARARRQPPPGPKTARRCARSARACARMRSRSAGGGPGTRPRTRATRRSPASWRARRGTARRSRGALVLGALVLVERVERVRGGQLVEVVGHGLRFRLVEQLAEPREPGEHPALDRPERLSEPLGELRLA